MIKLRVDELLANKGETRYWLVKEMDSNYTTVNRLVDNTISSIRFVTLEKLMRAFECDLADIFVVEQDER